MTPNLGNLCAVIMEGLFKCFDRRCTCDKKKTKKLLQEDYENINTGSEFELDDRYAQFLTTLFMVFMYSSGIPILYPIAFISILITYWCDKYFCKLKFYLILISAKLSQKTSCLHFASFAQNSHHHEI